MPGSSYDTSIALSFLHNLDAIREGMAKAIEHSTILNKTADPEHKPIADKESNLSLAIQAR